MVQLLKAPHLGGAGIVLYWECELGSEKDLNLP